MNIIVHKSSNPVAFGGGARRAVGVQSTRGVSLNGFLRLLPDAYLPSRLGMDMGYFYPAKEVFGYSLVWVSDPAKQAVSLSHNLFYNTPDDFSQKNKPSIVLIKICPP
jgi:hypothetical protein